MPVYLIRHAHAGSRSGWDGDDSRRPLSPKGRHQTEGLTTWLQDESIDRVLSSPSTRCVQTVDPIAVSHGLITETDPALAEGAGVDGCLELVRGAADQTLVLCSHGDLIPKVIRRLSAEGMRTSGPNLSQKGSAWLLVVDDGRAVSATYQPPFAKTD